MNDGTLRSATVEVIEVNVEMLGIHTEHLVRPIDYDAVYELAEKDASKWEPIEIRLWPDAWQKPSPEVRYHVVSGNHRTSAAKIKNMLTLRAILVDAPDEKSYLVAAISSNTQHGKNFTRDEYIANTKKLHAHGVSLSEIAKIIGYSKSAVSRMITGNDSHASSKQQSIEPEVITTSSVQMPRETGDELVKRKVMGLIMDAQIAAGVASTQDLVRLLRPAQQELLRNLIGWLQEVMMEG